MLPGNYLEYDFNDKQNLSGKKQPKKKPSTKKTGLKEIKEEDEEGDEAQADNIWDLDEEEEQEDDEDENALLSDDEFMERPDIDRE